MHQAAKLLIAGALTTLPIDISNATLPASQEQLVCGASSMILGKIVQVHVDRGSVIDITVQVIDEHDAASQSHKSPDIMEMLTDVRHPLMIDNRVIQSEENGTIEVGRPQEGTSALINLFTDDEVTAELMAKSFYFGVWLDSPNSPPWVRMWTLDGPGPLIWKEICPHSVWQPQRNAR